MATSQMTSFFDQLRRVVLLQDGGGMTDGQLLQCFLTSRAEAAFEALVQRHGPMVLGVCRRVLQNAHDAEDAFQATFVVFLRKAASIAPREFVGNWLYGVAYRTALKAKSTAAKRRMKESQVRDMPNHDSSETEIWHDLQPVLDQELNRLPDKYRVPVVLCDLEGKGRKEAARQLGCPEGTLSGRLARARTMLARRLARHGLTLSAGALATAITQNAAAASVPGPLLATTVKAAALVTAGKTITAGVISTKVAALAEGVMKTMLLAKLKIAAVMLMAVGVAGVGTGICTQQLLAEKAKPANPQKDIASTTDGKDSAKKGKKPKLEESVKGKDGKGKKSQEEGSFTGWVAGFSEDGKQLTLALTKRNKGAEPKTFDVKVTDKTAVTYFAVGPEGARLTKGYQAQVWLQEGSQDSAARLLFRGQQGKKPADLASRVAAVLQDSKGIALDLPAKKIKGQKKKPPQRIDIRFTPQTRLTFSNVGKGGAKPSASYGVSVWLEKGSKDTAAAVVFNGFKEGKKKKAVGGKLEGDPPPDSAGTVVALAPEGKGLTLKRFPPKKKDEKPQEPRKIDVKIDDKTQIIFYNVGPGGAQPAAGYQVQVWLQAGSKDTASTLRFTRSPKKGKGLAGKVAAIAAEGKSLTLEMPPKKKRTAAARLEIKITPKTNIIFNGVGPGGAKLTEGYRAHVVLQEGSTDTAETIIVGKKPGK